MPDFSRFYDWSRKEAKDMCSVIAFDPGETTGFAIMAVHKRILEYNQGHLVDLIQHIEYGQIDCRMGDGKGFEQEMHNHPGLNFDAENQGVTRMLNICERNQAAAIVFEDFIPDMKKMDQARHTLSPIRITSAFSYGLWRDRLDEGWPVQSMFVQNRSLAKTMATDARLTRWGLYDHKSGPHARDAIRHAYYFLRSCRGQQSGKDEKRWRAWGHLFEDPQVTQDTKGKVKRYKAPPKLGDRVNL